MKRLILVCLLALAMTGCTRRTEYGECVGLMDQQDPNLRYDISYWNGTVAVLLSGTVIVPLYTVAKQISCPTAKK